MRLFKLLSVALCLASLGIVSGCSEARYAAHLAKQIPFPGERSKSVGYFKVGSSYKIKGRRYSPTETYNFTQKGVASWYGPGFHGKLTANGEIFNQNDLTAAHKTLQLPSIIRVTNLENGRSVILRVNDRGPFAHDRILDVSERGAIVLGFKHKGTAKIKLEVLADASKEVAAMAKNKQNTRGYEIALNKNGYKPPAVRASNIVQTAQYNRPSARVSARPSAIIPSTKPEAVTQISLSAPQPYSSQGSVMAPPSQAAPLRKPMPVQTQPLSATARNQITTNNQVTASNISNLGVGKIYVQAGSFSQEQNALTLSNRLSTYGQSKVYMTKVNNKPFFRVRLGPYENRGAAKEILTALNTAGNKNAVIIVD